ncbi:hypothetical protein [Micromonospora sp. NPDC004704]
MVYQFLAHRSPSKSRIFALIRATDDHLEAVTTLGAADAAVTDDLVSALNIYLADRAEKPLHVVLDRLPDAVRIAVQNFVRERCVFELGAFTNYGPVDNIRLSYFDGADDQFIQYLEAAYTVGLGIRATNELSGTGNVGWEVELRSDEVFVPGSAEPRTWPLPDGIPVLRTWTSQESPGESVVKAVTIAMTASDDGRYVRLHTLIRGGGETEMTNGATSEFVVDIFDAPIPPSADDE